MNKILLIASDHAGYNLKQSLIGLTGSEFFEDLGTNTEFEAHFKAENLKMVSGDYTVDISTTAKISNWKGTVASYWIAMEAKVD